MPLGAHAGTPWPRPWDKPVRRVFLSMIGPPSHAPHFDDHGFWYMPASAAADALMGFLLSRRLLLCVLHTQALQVALRPSGYLIHLMKAVLAYTRLDNFHGISLSSSQTETFRLRVSQSRMTTHRAERSRRIGIASAPAFRRLPSCVLHAQTLLKWWYHTVPENRFQEIVRETLMPHMVQ